MAKCILLDLDGTVYEGNNLIEGSSQFIEEIRGQGLKVYFCTNNSSQSSSSIMRKLNRLGISADEGDIISSGLMAIDYCVKHNLKNVYFAGSDELRNEFLRKGINLCEAEQAEYLIIGMDSDFNYRKLVSAVRAALVVKNIFICNEDWLFPKEDGIYPGCGAIVSSILSPCQRKYDLMFGKPEVLMMDYVSSRMGYSPSDMIVIGDSLTSDMAMADKYGSRGIHIGSDYCPGSSAPCLKDMIKWDWAAL